MPEFQEKAQLLQKEAITDTIFRFTLQAPNICGSAHPGQFVMVRVAAGHDPLLRRPFSIHQVTAGGRLQILFKVVGKGTARLANFVSGDVIDCIGPLGRGFFLKSDQRIGLLGGGMGIAPLYFLAKRLLQTGIQTKNTVVFLGARCRDELTLFAEEFFALGYNVQTATDDGSLGYHGFVTDLLDAYLDDLEQIYTCGPFPMMRIAAMKAQAADISCAVSLETHMACGLGACLGCTVPGVNDTYIHVCRQGPVFSADEVLWTL